MGTQQILENAMEKGKGILRLVPNWVPRSFCIPGRRIKLHPDDYYALGGERGGLDERWLASTTPAENGPLTSQDEGLSFIVSEDGGRVQKISLRDAVADLKGALIGDRLWEAHGGWPMYSKFFDNQEPLPHHIHHDDAHAARVGRKGKPESYYFPIQMNNHGGDFPFTFFGFNPGVTKEQVRDCIAAFAKGDNKITAISRAYRLEPGTGWNVPPGVLHAPGSLCTYEPQKASDVAALFQSVIMNRRVIPGDWLWKNCPPEEVGNVDYLMELIDWEKNVDPDFYGRNFMRPVAIQSPEEAKEGGYQERWISYRSDAFSAKELTIAPGRTVHVHDGGAYGLICVQGHGRLGEWPIESPTLIRYGELTHDEYFVSEAAASEGVKIVNASPSESLVILKHFGPGHPDLPAGL